MNEHNQELGESELRHIRPAAPPPELQVRLAAARPMRRLAARPAPEPAPAWNLWLRWLIPATAVVLAILIWRSPTPPAPQQPQLAVDTGPAAKADDVEIGQELVSSFDTVALLPGGEPVRFRCQEWMEDVVLKDKQRGLTIEQRMPRVEVIPVRFETY